MQTILSTRDVPAPQAFEYWHDVASRRISPHEGKPADRTHFAAEIQIGSLVDLHLMIWNVSPSEFDVTSRHVTHFNDDNLFLVRLAAGRAVIELGEHEIVPQVGDMWLLDPRLPNRGRLHEHPLPA